MELNFKNCFKYYDDELLKCLNFEVRLKNYKIAEFNNIDCFLEYTSMLNIKSKKYRCSKKKWISYGGLKWCCLDDFQEELKKSNDKRKISDFNFEDASDSIIKKIKEIERYVFGGIENE